MNDQQLLRYSRHILLPELDITGQQRLLASKVLVVGCGGLGSTVIPFLAASGVGHLLIADHDKIELSNLQRQTHYTEQQIDQYKAQAMADTIKQQNSAVCVDIITEQLTYLTLLPLLAKCDVIVDCTDNFTTRQAINKAAVLTKKPLVFGAAIRFEGQLTVFDSRNNDSPCYACLFEDTAMSAESCASSGVFSPLVGIIGAQQAAETLKIITDIGRVPVGTLINYDCLNSRTYPIQFKRNPHCKVCAAHH